MLWWGDGDVAMSSSAMDVDGRAVDRQRRQHPRDGMVRVRMLLCLVDAVAAGR